MAVIKSGNSTDQWTIDPISKAGHVTLYNPDGSLVSFPSGLTDAQLRATPVPVSGTISVSGSVAVTGTFFQATQPVSGPLTDGQLRATPVPVSGTIAVSGSVAVTGTFFQSTQPISAVSLPLPSGAAQDASLATIDADIKATQPRDTIDRAGRLLGIATINAAPGNVPNAALAVTATGIAGAAVTCTLPAVVGQFHYITLIEIVRYATAAITGTATPVVVTTTNLPGSPAYTFATAAAIGTTDVRNAHVMAMPLKSSVANTATTIVCPATSNVIWRVNVYYQAAV